jgi:transposase
MQFSFDTLLGVAQKTFDQDPLSGHLFLFFNRKRDRIKILFWDVHGFCIWYKRLEVGAFELPVAQKVTKASSSHQVMPFPTCTIINRCDTSRRSQKLMPSMAHL